MSRVVDEARFRKLFDEAHAVAIQGYLADGTVVYWNRAAEEIYGYAADEVLGDNLLDLIIPAEMRDDVRRAVRWMCETGHGIPAGRLVLRHKDGSPVPVYSSHTVVTIADELPVLFCMDADMRSLAQAEAELRIAAAAFESQQGMLITDAKGVVLRANRALIEITGYSQAEIVGTVPRMFDSGRHSPKFFVGLWRRLRASGKWQGEIWNKRKNGEVYASWVMITAVLDAVSGAVTHYVVALNDISQRKAAEETIAHLAYFDPLTRLPNRRLLIDRLQQTVSAAQRGGEFGALLFIDLDNFKTLNDTLGHDVGDLLLCQVAERLSGHIRKNGIAARLGGDEFVLMLENLGPDQQSGAFRAEAIGKEVLAALSECYILREAQYTGSVSIGVTLFTVGAGTAEQLMKQADLAMYEAKAAGRNALCFFEPEMQEAVAERAALINGLREALNKQQFFLLYQPQVDHRGKVLGAETLVRWECPGQGMVSPDDFVPIAEESGLILPLGRWVLESACRRLATWAQDPTYAELSLAVNVSAVQFGRADFVDTVLTVLRETGAHPQRLKLELTESLLVDKIDGVVAKMLALKRCGVVLSLDDFGTGYSSLAYLKRLPLDQLKVDRAFVRDLSTDANSAAIARTIVVLGQTMGLTVIAEGVETEVQRAILSDMGCRVFQGYLFGRPQALSEFESLAAETRPHEAATVC